MLSAELKDWSNPMRASIAVVSVLLVAACAGTPPADRSSAVKKVEASQVADMQKFGYTIKDKNGQKLYCSKEVQTGSHLDTTTACLTEEQWMRASRDSQSRLQDITKQTATLPVNPGH